MNKLTVSEKNIMKHLIETQDNLILKFEEYSKITKELQLKIEFQKLCASSRNHKSKLASVVIGNESE